MHTLTTPINSSSNASFVFSLLSETANSTHTDTVLHQSKGGFYFSKDFQLSGENTPKHFNVSLFSTQRENKQIHKIFIAYFPSLFSTFPPTLDHYCLDSGFTCSEECICVCPSPSGTSMTEVVGSGKLANQKSAAPRFLSWMANIPQLPSSGCQEE